MDKNDSLILRKIRSNVDRAKESSKRFDDMISRNISDGIENVDDEELWIRLKKSITVLGYKNFM